MERAWLYVVLPAFVQLFNGCIAPPAEDVGLALVDARVVPGPCFVGLRDEGRSCQVLEVRVANNETERWAEVGPHAWSALDADGTAWGPPLVGNETAVAPDTARTLVLGFTTAAGARLVQLRWNEARLDLP